MNWYKIRDRRINLSLIDVYRPCNDYDDNEYSLLLWSGNSLIEIEFYTKEERDEELRKLDEALEKGLHTISEFNLP